MTALVTPSWHTSVTRGLVPPAGIKVDLQGSEEKHRCKKKLWVSRRAGHAGSPCPPFLQLCHLHRHCPALPCFPKVETGGQLKLYQIFQFSKQCCNNELLLHLLPRR